MFYITSKAPASFALLESFTGTRSAARTRAAELGGTVRDEADYAKAQAANTSKAPAPVGKPVAFKGLQDALSGKAPKAAKKAKAPKTAKTPKRAETTPAALAAGAKALAAAIKAELNKVGVVRAVSGVDGLQRRDVFAIIQAADLGIADATISTQFQVTRSGKLAK